MSAPSVVTCPTCAKKNRVPADATGTPRCASCKSDLPWVVDATTADWSAVVERSPVPVLVDFWAAWCGPCRMVGPLLEDLAGERAGSLKLVRVDVDAEPALSRRFGVQGIPMLALVEGTTVLARQTGAAGIDRLRRWLDDGLAAGA